MKEKEVLLKMLRQLLDDLQNVQQKGTGYYTCEPFVSRYNKILEFAQNAFRKDSSLLETFVPVGNTDSVDPLDKMKVMQKVMIEGDQLMVVLASTKEAPTEP
jgi:hypothetical protein